MELIFSIMATCISWLCISLEWVKFDFDYVFFLHEYCTSLIK